MEGGGTAAQRAARQLRGLGAAAVEDAAVVGAAREWGLVRALAEQFGAHHQKVQREAERLIGGGGAVAEGLNRAFDADGLSVHSTWPSVDAGGRAVGLRLSISVTDVFLRRRFPDGLPEMPAALRDAMFPGATGRAWLRSAHWFASPPGTPAQREHVDVADARGRSYRQLVVKRDGGETTTQVRVRGSDGPPRPVGAPLLLMDSTLRHRGAANPAERWVYSLGMELVDHADLAPPDYIPVGMDTPMPGMIGVDQLGSEVQAIPLPPLDDHNSPN